MAPKEERNDRSCRSHGAIPRTLETATDESESIIGQSPQLCHSVQPSPPCWSIFLSFALRPSTLPDAPQAVLPSRRATRPASTPQALRERRRRPASPSPRRLARRRRSVDGRVYVMGSTGRSGMRQLGQVVSPEGVATSLWQHRIPYVPGTLSVTGPGPLRWEPCEHVEDVKTGPLENPHLSHRHLSEGDWRHLCYPRVPTC